MADIEITREDVYETNDGQWIIVIEVCNHGSSAFSGKLTSWPYDKDSKKIKTAADEKPISIPAGECKTYNFKYATKPKSSYTDVYDANNKKVDGEINELAAVSVKQGNGKGLQIADLIAPYPESLFREFGATWAGHFEIETIEGLPSGWTADILYPPMRGPFRPATSDRQHPGAIFLYVPPGTAEGTVATMHVVQHAVGDSAPPPGIPDAVYYIHNRIRLVVDTTAPSITMSQKTSDPVARTITLQLQASDVAGIDSVTAIFSTNGGTTYACMPMVISTTDGGAWPTNPVFEPVLGPFGAGQTVLTRYRVRDEVGNETLTAPQSTTF